MRVIASVLLAATVTACVRALTPCCVPDQWTASFGEQIGSNNAGKGGLTSIVGGLTYDFTGERVAMKLTTTIMPPGKTTNTLSIANYKTGMGYMVDLDADKCYKQKLSGKMPQSCIPKEALNTAVLAFGAGTDTLIGNSWMFSMKHGGLNANVACTVTAKDCVPIGEIAFGQSESVNFMANFGFFNSTLSIKDPSVFNIPEICQTSALAALIGGRPKSGLESYVLMRFGLPTFAPSVESNLKFVPALEEDVVNNVN